MDISDLRKEIDSIDAKMIDLFVSRMNVVRSIGELKKQSNIPVTDVSREAEVIEKAVSSVPPELTGYAVKFMKSVMDISKDLQKNE